MGWAPLGVLLAGVLAWTLIRAVLDYRHLVRMRDRLRDEEEPCDT